MGRAKELRCEIRAQAIILRKQGLTYREIKEKLKVSLCAVYAAVKRYEETHKYVSKIRSGRPRVTTIQDDRTIERIVKKSPKASSLAVLVRLPPEVRNISTRTIRRRLFDCGLKSRVPARKPGLSAKNIADRIRFCKQYRDWTEKDWETVMFSDETTMTQFYSYCRHVRRPPLTRYKAKYIVPTVKQAPKIMIWGAISAFGRAGLWFMPPNTTINGQTYLNVLKQKLPTFMSVHGTQFFQHDGAPCHTSKVVTDWLHISGVKIL
jgi:transposase